MPLNHRVRLDARWPNAAIVIALAVSLVIVASPVLAQAQNPFSLGGLEGTGGRPQSGFAAAILQKQAEFSRAMTAAARAIRTDWTALFGLVGLAFAYGLFHAAGPGHGKAIVASYVVANEAQLRRGAAVASAAALLQALVAIAMVGLVALVFGGTARSVTGAVNAVELASYAAIAAFGLWLLWRKLRALLALWRGDGAAACAHLHMPAPGQAGRWNLRQAGAAAVAAGIRPCSGAILILVFTLAQGIFWAGVLAALAMAAGVALATSGIAALAVYAKSFSVRMASDGGDRGLWAVALIETAAAVMVTALGLLLLSGLAVSIGGA
jgi:nickel/cobalt transporter (NicO) family protein